MTFESVASTFAQHLIMYLLPVLIAAIAGYLLVKAGQGLAQLKANKPDVYAALMFIARGAVKAAEQAGLSGFIADKKSYAFDLIEQWLEKKGWVIDLDLIDAAIEEAVWDEINKYKQETGGLIPEQS